MFVGCVYYNMYHLFNRKELSQSSLLVFGWNDYNIYNVGYEMKLLPLYDKKVKEHLDQHSRYYRITIELTPKFLAAARERIIEGHKKYGDDWQTKDNIKEIHWEKLDIFNYDKLNECQKEWKNES